MHVDNFCTQLNTWRPKMFKYQSVFVYSDGFMAKFCVQFAGDLQWVEIFCIRNVNFKFELRWSLSACQIFYACFKLLALCMCLRCKHGVLCIGQDTATNALYGVSELKFVCRSCETDAVHRPAATRFVQDAQSTMRLAETWQAYLTVCSITCYLLMMDYVSVSLFYISISSPYFAHFVARFIS